MDVAWLSRIRRLIILINGRNFLTRTCNKFTCSFHGLVLQTWKMRAYATKPCTIQRMHSNATVTTRRIHHFDDSFTSVTYGLCSTDFFLYAGFFPVGFPFTLFTTSTPVYSVGWGFHPILSGFLIPMTMLSPTIDLSPERQNVLSCDSLVPRDTQRHVQVFICIWWSNP